MRTSPRAISRLMCSFVRRSSYYMSKLLWSLSSYDNRVASLVFAVRRWAREASITQSTPGPWFSNFQMTIMVLFYLQSVGVLPKLNYINEQPSFASAQDAILNGTVPRHGGQRTRFYRYASR